MIKGIYIEKRVVNMPINVHSELPAKKIMESENIFMMDENRAYAQDIRPLKIAVLNLMPLKEDTEVQLLRSLSNTPLLQQPISVIIHPKHILISFILPLMI